ncbi:MAG: alpha/beta fold hydrolase [Myxococcaceae bacterium]|nr:alpha/beta fold hydrolase [Myxococcaceae bacterium]MCI0671968.1 alpha/beta fold hydrolase [Myxococcaceae bacterium]
MTSLIIQWRRLQREASNLAGYVQLNRHGRQVERRTDFTRCTRPVLLLYGLLSTRRVLEVLEHRLRRDGYCVWSIHLGGMFDALNTRGIDESAALVAQKVERMYARYQMGPLAIIGHSLGGLIGRYYVKRLGGDQRVCTLITLGTPHAGTPVAYLGCATVGAVSPSVWQITPRARFLRALDAGAFPRHVRLVSIYSRADGLSPYPSCLLGEPAADNLAHVEVTGVGHRDFLTRRAVYAHVRKELSLAFAPAQAHPRTLPFSQAAPVG